MPIPSINVTESTLPLYASEDSEAPAQTEQERNEVLWLRLIRQAPAGGADPCYGCVDWFIYEQPRPSSSEPPPAVS